MSIEGDSSGVLLRLPEGKTLTAQDAESLLYEQLGWHMPLAGLHYWVRGLPQPDAPFTKALDEQGRLVSLHQAGWDIRFPSYVQVAGVDLPRKVFLENHPLSVRLVIQSWERG
jgi:outer membrane lipoprotein LolB